MTASSGGDEPTLSFYSDDAENYAKFADPDGNPEPLEAFVSLLAPGASVMDFGCGSAWAANRFRTMGFEVSAFDGSAGLAAQAKELYDIDVTVGSFEVFDDRDAYDGIWASFCLLHGTRDAMPANLSRLATALRDNGHLYLGLIEGEGSERDSFGRRYTYFNEAEIRELLNNAGFDVLSVDRTPGKRYDGSPVFELHTLARRR
ncbi:MAG: class I SAM-dependent methyltransferase [Pseudomonadota bacterium]